MDLTNATSNGRNPGGRFASGNSLAKGNPVNRRMSQLRAAILDTETPERVAEVVAKMRSLALGGDATAAKIYLEICLGRAPQAVELSGPDGEPLGVDWPKVEKAVLAALAPFGADAKIAVALALRGAVVESVD